jgi:peptidoglycan/LPS O-acetylase OafA/YrhL
MRNASYHTPPSRAPRNDLLTSRRHVVALLGLLLTILGPVVYSFLFYNPFARATGAPMWGLMGAGSVLALVAVARDRSRRVLILAGVSVGLTFLALAVFFWLLDVPEAPVAMRMDTAPDFTLTDHQGRQVTLSDRCKQGPILLLFYRGHW